MKRWKIPLCLSVLVSFNGCILLDNNTSTPEGLSGSLVDEQGVPAANALVKAYSADTTVTALAKLESSSENPVDSTWADARGRFTFTHLKSGDYDLVGTCRKGDSIRVVSHRGVHYKGPVDVGCDTVKAPGVILIGVQSNGLPLKGVLCSLVGRSSAAVSDDSGRCLLVNVPPGVAQLRMTKSGFQPVTADGILVHSDKITHANTVNMVAVPFAGTCWSFKQSNGYYGTIFIRELGNHQIWDSLDNWETSTGQQVNFGLGTGVDSTYRIYFDQNFPTSPIIGYYSADVRGDSLVNGVTNSNEGDHATWYAVRTACP